MNIIELLKSDKSVAFVDYMKKVLGINYYSIAYANLMGFTIEGNRLQFKNYYELKEIPSDELLAEFLPEIESFKTYAQFWDKDVESSLALGLKLDDEETKYFHVKFGVKSELVFMERPPALIRLLTNRQLAKGISFEYKNGIVTKKYYFYVYDKEDIAKVLAFNKIQADPQALEHLECYYTDDDFKVNLIYTTPPLNGVDMGQLDDATLETYRDIAKFLYERQKYVWYVGNTKSGKLSIYFSTTDDKDFISKL